MRFRRARRYGKPRNQGFHHIVLPSFRPRPHTTRAALQTVTASMACNIEIVVIRACPRCGPRRSALPGILARRLIARDLLTKKSCRCRCSALEFFKMRCYSAWPPALQVFLQCDNGVIRGNAQPVRGQRHATQQSRSIFRAHAYLSVGAFRSGRGATHRLHGGAGHGFRPTQHLSSRGFMAWRTGRLRGAPFNPSHANHQTTEFLERSTR